MSTTDTTNNPRQSLNGRFSRCRVKEEKKDQTFGQEKEARESEGEEITLRPFSSSDADALMAWASDPRVNRFQRRDRFTTEQQAIDYIATHIARHPWYRAICLRGRVVGSISATPGTGPGGACRASLGYRLAYDYWGKGIATAAVRRTATVLFEEWPWLERLEAVADVENPASQRVLEKAGFKREAVLRKYLVLKSTTRDMVMYSLLSSDRTHA